MQDAKITAHVKMFGTKNWGVLATELGRPLSSVPHRWWVSMAKGGCWWDHWRSDIFTIKWLSLSLPCHDVKEYYVFTTLLTRVRRRSFLDPTLRLADPWTDEEDEILLKVSDDCIIDNSCDMLLLVYHNDCQTITSIYNVCTSNGTYKHRYIVA